MTHQGTLHVVGLRRSLAEVETMMRIPRLGLLFVIGVAAAGIASADERFDAGRPTAACRLVVQVPGWAGSRRAAKCTDGDPCDTDGGADGSCGASVSLC